MNIWNKLDTLQKLAVSGYSVALLMIWLIPVLHDGFGASAFITAILAFIGAVVATVARMP